MRKLALVLMTCVGLAGLWLAKPRTFAYQLNVRTYFRTAQSLRPGTRVLVDGVEVGSIRKVSLGLDSGERPVEVFISIGTPYHLSIPCDSTAELSAQGVLGPTVVEIDTRKATGPPVANNGVLKSFEVEMTDSQAAHAMKVLGLTLVEESRKIPEKEKPPIAK